MRAAEAALLAHLSHPAIIRHIESFEADGHLCIVTEYAERGDLSARLEERKGVWLPESQVLSYFVQMCLALLYLHKRKVLHRDLKLANVRRRAQQRHGGACGHSLSSMPVNIACCCLRLSARRSSSQAIMRCDWATSASRACCGRPWSARAQSSARRTTSAQRSARGEHRSNHPW